MQSNTEQVIPASKFKLVLLILGALIFLALGIWLSLLDAAFIEAQHRWNSPALIHTVGAVAVVFAALCAAFGVKKLFDDRPGLVLNHLGITDHSSALAAGLIPWAEIRGFATYQVQRQKLLILLLHHPQPYLEAGGWWKRLMLQANFKMCGSPICISASALSISFDELVELCMQYHARYGHATE